MNARTAGAVPSGRMLTERPSRSGNVYICFSTTSVTSPTPRTKSSVYSRIGVRTSRYANASSTWRAFSSTNCHLDTSGARMSFMPFTDAGTSAIAPGFIPSHSVLTTAAPNRTTRLPSAASTTALSRPSRVILTL